MSFTTIAQNLNQGLLNVEDQINGINSAILTPKTAQGINGFLFDIPREESIELRTDVTDHVTENNSFINDHVVNQPITVTLTGYQGELLFERPAGIAGGVQQLQNRLETVEAYLGELTPGFVQASQQILNQTQRAVSIVNQTVQRVQNVIGLVAGPEGQEETRQQRAYNELNGLRLARTPVTLQTPWAYFDSMIITSLSFSQRENSPDISEISVSLKEFRVAEVQTVSFDEDLLPPRQEVQSTPQEDQGNIRGTEENISSLRSAVDAARGEGDEAQ